MTTLEKVRYCNFPIVFRFSESYFTGVILEEMQIWARGERLAIDKLVLDAIEEVRVNNPLLDQSLDYIQAFQQPRIFRQVRREFNGRLRNGR